MTRAYLVVAGMSPGAAAAVVLDQPARDALTRLGACPAAGPPLLPARHGCERGAAHLAWCWRALSGDPAPLETAPWRWRELGGPDLSGQLWWLGLGHRAADGARSDLGPALDEGARRALERALRPALERHGLILQRWDDEFFVVARSDWLVRAALWPLPLFPGRGPAHPLAAANAATRAAARALRRSLTEALDRAAITAPDGRALNLLWLSGGGRWRRFRQPGAIRLVETTDPVIRGWARSAGALARRPGAAGAAPPGERLIALDELYLSWLARDWEAWRAALPGLVERILEHCRQARAGGCDEALIVACGGRSALLLSRPLSALRGWLAPRRSGAAADPASWLTVD